MAYKAKKTEHSGSKKGCGAYWGPKRDAKRESSRARRQAAQGQVMADADKGCILHGGRKRAHRTMPSPTLPTLPPEC
jgi:hypothetical protein